MGLQNVIEIVEREMIFPNSQMIGVRVELNAMNGRFFFEPFNNLVHSVINDINPSFLPS